MAGKQATQGVKNLSYAIATVGEDGTVSYGSVKKISDLQKINLSVKGSGDKAYADDAVADIINSFEGGTITIDTYGIDNATIAELEGHETDSNKVIIYNTTDEAPYVAIGFEAQKRNKATRFCWLLLCKKSNDAEEYETKGAKINAKGQTMTFEIAERKDNNWRYRVDSDDNTTTPMTAEKWFNKVYDGSLT